MSKREDALALLEEEVAALKEKKAKLVGELSEVDAELKALERGIGSLRGKRQRSKSKSATNAQVIQFAEEVLASGHSVSVDVLTAQLKEKVQSSGCALTGFALRVKQALRESRFECTDDTVRLKKAEVASWA